jgi:hypothetical protein
MSIENIAEGSEIDRPLFKELGYANKVLWPTNPQGGCRQTPLR